MFAPKTGSDGKEGNAVVKRGLLVSVLLPPPPPLSKNRRVREPRVGETAVFGTTSFMVPNAVSQESEQPKSTLLGAVSCEPFCS